MTTKTQLLQHWGENIQRAVNAGKFGKTPQRLAIGIVSGPRVGGLDIVAREDPAALKKSFNEQEGLNVAATVPWVFGEGKVNVFSKGRVIRVEVPWPAELAETNISLKSVMQTVQKHVVDGWVIGRDDQGRTIIPNFRLEPHWLFSGATGSGKSVSLQSAVAQMAMSSRGRVKFVLIDGKGGESMSSLASIPHLIGPVAYDLEGASGALTWLLAEMAQRYAVLRDLDSTGRADWEARVPRIVVVIDEVQTITQSPALNTAIVTLLQQARSAKINLLISTQHPTAAVLGSSTIKTNASGRVTLRLNSADASRTAIGDSEPNAQNLLGKGDCYVSAAGSFARVQVAYLSRAEIAAMPKHQPEFSEWPGGEAEAVLEGTTPTGFSPQQLAIALYCAENNIGRPTLKKMLDDAGVGKIGMQRLYGLQKFSQEVFSAMSEIQK